MRCSWNLPAGPYGLLIFLSLPGPGDRMKGAHEGRKVTEDTRRTEVKKIKIPICCKNLEFMKFRKVLWRVTGDLTGGESGRWGGKIYFPWHSGVEKERRRTFCSSCSKPGWNCHMGRVNNCLFWGGKMQFSSNKCFFHSKSSCEIQMLLNVELQVGWSCEKHLRNDCD